MKNKTENKHRNMFKKPPTVLWTSAMLLMCVTGIHTYSINYFDCRKPTLIKQFWRPSVCTSLQETSSEKALRKSFEVFAENTVRELAG
ncbi:MAG: hypothetical protein GY696_37270 [Gammaproteobacteria bacterium]|nr:hypothetical protein [Gammaproteobacteria bacterium]